MGFDQFMKKNQKVETKEVEYAATKTLTDENGQPLKWKFRKLSSRDFFILQDSEKKSDMARVMAVKCCVYPNLRNQELQDSYGVKTPDELLQRMIPDADEMAALLVLVGNLNDFKTLSDEVEEAKN